jgi:ATP synthase F1 gamma subunit
MSEIREKKEQMEAIRAVQYITSAFRDISATELSHYKELFEKNKTFRDEMRELYTIVWRIAASSGKTDILTTQKKKPVFIAYTTNHHFYGSLNEDVITTLIQATSVNDDCIIIGETGRSSWYSRKMQRKNVHFISFKEDTPNKEETKNFLRSVSEYPYVYVYYPRFQTVFTQKADMIDITFRPNSSEEKKEAKSNALFSEYILEPELQEMLQFFNQQIRYVLFEQILLETQLSRVSARLVKMDAADQNAHNLLQQEGRLLRRAKNSASGRRMLETLVGYIQWHTEKSPQIVR